ncbi:glutathione-independent methylglyoxalase [Saccharomycopsis crataegensis]|uniref:D-lactate dehydratase n=1 Tax=Saccharomycopsis crataegensis TaxID=43959 RepID=A0AAV5QSD0_9ASCO|nr:glutathione-independent methylglyoxalase [Saccharomycopsis crataegensis]
MSKVLLAIPSYHGAFYADGAKTGLFYIEALHPFNAFRKAGYQVDIVSEDGHYGIDEHSTIDAFLVGDDGKVYRDANSEFNVALKNTKSAADVDPKDYKIAFAAAGHGAMWYPKEATLRKLFVDIYANNGVAAAVCHGPAIFAGLEDPITKKPFFSGKKATGFTDIGEVQAGADDAMKKYNLDTIKTLVERDNGTYVEPAGPWDDFTVADGRFITGVNPQSATSTAEKAIAAASA